MITSFIGIFFLLAGIGGGALLFSEFLRLDTQVPVQIIYFVPTAYLIVLGIGILRRHMLAYVVAKTVALFSLILLMAFAAFYWLAFRFGGGVIPWVEISGAVAGGGVCYFIYRYLKREQVAEAFWREKVFVSKKFVRGIALIVNIASLLLLADALTFRLVNRQFVLMTGQSANVAADKPFFVPVVPAVQASRDPSLPPVLPPKTLPAGPLVTLPNTGEIFWLDGNRYMYTGTNIGQIWNPETGSLKDVTLPASFHLHSLVSTPAGLLFAGGNTSLINNPPAHYATWAPYVADDRIVLVTPENKAITAKLSAPRATPDMLVLSDRKVLVAGGVSAWQNEEYGHHDVKQRSKAVELVTIKAGELVVEKLPDLPVAVTRGYSLVALADGRVMALGGTNSPYLGCEACSAETFILDIDTKKWSAGPKMTEPRAFAGATLLSDGSVLVAGGWTPGHGWGKDPARTTERWDPRSNAFSSGALLPVGDAMHRLMWAPGKQGKQLLLAGGISGSAQAYDIASGKWRLAGEWYGPQDSFGLVPLVYKDKPYLWLLGGNEPSLIALRLPFDGEAAGAGKAASDFERRLYRSGSAFLPGRGDTPSLVLGGSVMAREPSYLATGAVDAVGPDGRVQSLAPLNRVPGNARAFRLPDGSVLVAGRFAGDGSDKPEWLQGGKDAGQAEWVTLDAGIPFDAALGQLADGSLVAVDSDGGVERLTFTGAEHGKPGIQRESLPPLNLHDDSFTVKGLPDGRIIVVGGARPTEKIALLQENSQNNDAPDTYVGIGEESAVDTYQIYDPAKQEWHSSAPSDTVNGKIAILDDGRVVTLVGSAFKISSADGKSWGDLQAVEPPSVLLSGDARLFVIHGELFLSGGANGHTDKLQWFDFSDKRWKTLWQPSPDYATKPGWIYAHMGLIVSRQLANGKRVVLPVDGL